MELIWSYTIYSPSVILRLLPCRYAAVGLYLLTEGGMRSLGPPKEQLKVVFLQLSGPSPKVCFGCLRPLPSCAISCSPGTGRRHTASVVPCMQVLGTRTLPYIHNPTWRRGKHCHFDGGNPLALTSKSLPAGAGAGDVRLNMPDTVPVQIRACAC